MENQRLVFRGWWTYPRIDNTESLRGSSCIQYPTGMAPRNSKTGSIAMKKTMASSGHPVWRKTEATFRPRWEALMVASEAWAHPQNRPVEIEKMPRDITKFLSNEYVSWRLLESLEFEKRRCSRCVSLASSWCSLCNTCEHHMKHGMTYWHIDDGIIPHSWQDQCNQFNTAMQFVTRN